MNKSCFTDDEKAYALRGIVVTEGGLSTFIMLRVLLELYESDIVMHIKLKCNRRYPFR